MAQEYGYQGDRTDRKEHHGFNDGTGAKYTIPLLSQGTSFVSSTLDSNGYVKSTTAFIDNTGTTQGVKFIDGKPRVSAMPYLYDIAEGNVSGHTPWSKIGYCPSFSAGVNTDIWSYDGLDKDKLSPCCVFMEDNYEDK